MSDRRTFIKGLSAAALTTALGPGLGLTGAPSLTETAEPRFRMDSAIRALLMEAIDAAMLAGASYADARIARQQTNVVRTRERQIEAIEDSDTIGCGVRVLVNGAWGFAATPRLAKDAVARAAREAVAVARANGLGRG
jgi:TldD protein